MKIVAMGFRGFPGVEGGIETHAEQLYPRLAESVDELHIVTRAEYSSEKRPYQFGKLTMVPRSSGPVRSLETFVHTFNALAYAVRERADMIHVHGIGPAVVTPLARLFGMDVVVTHHGKDYDADKWSSFARLALKVGEWVGMRFATQRITVSNHLREHVESKFSVRAHAIPNGVNPPLLVEDSSVLDSLGLEAGKYIVEVARISQHKRQHELIAAFRDAQCPGWKLVLVGDFAADDRYAQQVVSAAGEDENVILAGFRQGDELAGLFQNAGLFALPSSYEGMPIAVLEALSYSLPTVLSDIPAHREIALPEDHYHAIGDVAALTGLLERFTSHEDVVLLRQKSRLIAAAYNWEAIAGQTLGVIQRASAGRVSVDSPCKPAEFETRSGQR